MYSGARIAAPAWGGRPAPVTPPAAKGATDAPETPVNRLQGYEAPGLHEKAWWMTGVPLTLGDSTITGVPLTPGDPTIETISMASATATAAAAASLLRLAAADSLSSRRSSNRVSFGSSHDEVGSNAICNAPIAVQLMSSSRRGFPDDSVSRH
eukprot:5098990-Prymnesium_polylepis.3